ncbi:hypothetical protein HOD20_05010 [archaeon]|jgi:hypothetical protein|nr:hypothetical protein [archaeon]MBT4647679.1 hypothetical protein [archaeon]MBT6822351.1 hypothetical protein [archaeon]MBT7391499.1 hypothetical protein [archaeon]
MNKRYAFLILLFLIIICGCSSKNEGNSLFKLAIEGDAQERQEYLDFIKPEMESLNNLIYLNIDDACNIYYSPSGFSCENINKKIASTFYYLDDTNKVFVSPSDLVREHIDYIIDSTKTEIKSDIIIYPNFFDSILHELEDNAKSSMGHELSHVKFIDNYMSDEIALKFASYEFIDKSDFRFKIYNEIYAYYNQFKYNDENNLKISDEYEEHINYFYYKFYSYMVIYYNKLNDNDSKKVLVDFFMPFLLELQINDENIIQFENGKYYLIYENNEYLLPEELNNKVKDYSVNDLVKKNIKISDYEDTTYRHINTDGFKNINSIIGSGII